MEGRVRRDWTSIIEQLNRSRNRGLRIRMGSPGSAQVTRCRLLEQWTNLRVRTRGAMLYIELAS
jgi:hypothetical protein